MSVPAMSDMANFSKSIQARLINAGSEPHWTTGDVNAYMANVALRRQQFEELASHLVGEVIRPRMETLTSYFANANPIDEERKSSCSCELNHSERFPAETTIRFAVEHDVQYDGIVIRFDARMMPTFVPFNEQDKLTLIIKDADDERVAEWVERRLLEFLDAYLRIDSSQKCVGHDTAVDPVCGMRIIRSKAAATTLSGGHTFYFCCSECLARFEQKPTLFVKSKTMN